MTYILLTCTYDFAGDLYQLPDTEDNVFVKVYIIAGLAFAGRGCEIIALQYDDVERLVSASGEVSYKLTYVRAKGVDGISSDGDYAFVTGKLEVDTLDRYRAMFPPAQRNDRFFRKVLSKRGVLGVGKQKVGKGTAVDVGKKAASLLGLPHPERYTGHTWRRSALTWAANQGRSLVQMKALSGHKSDTVVQGYVEKSDIVRKENAAVTAVQEPTSQVSSQVTGMKRSSEEIMEAAEVFARRVHTQMSAPITINLNLAGATVHGSIDIRSGNK